MLRHVGIGLDAPGHHGHYRPHLLDLQVERPRDNHPWNRDAKSSASGALDGLFGPIWTWPRRSGRDSSAPVIRSTLAVPPCPFSREWVWRLKSAVAVGKPPESRCHRFVRDGLEKRGVSFTDTRTAACTPPGWKPARAETRASPVPSTSRLPGRGRATRTRVRGATWPVRQPTWWRFSRRWKKQKRETPLQ